MTVDEALLVADGLGLPGAAISGATTKLALDRLAAEVRRQHAELERLQAQLDASRRDAERAAGTASKLADQRLTTRVEADIETQRWQARVNAEIESACSNRVLTATDETRLRDFIDATFGVKP
jgi:outer membrane murein-binding lipoprotein Lpp